MVKKMEDICRFYEKCNLSGVVLLIFELND